jgi:release factor glutamine methyltransferase
MREIIKKVSEEFHITKNEAELVIATLLEQPRFGIYFKGEVDKKTLSLLKMKLRQLKEGVPIEYIAKKIQFMDYSLNIYPGVFIPRLETEYFVELIERLVKPVPKMILDIGTGCGAIAISLAEVFPEAHIIATDISAAAIDNASDNIQKFNLGDRITTLRCNLFEGLLTQFDLIVSNPPYIPTSRIKLLPKSVKDFEPILAIDGGYQGVHFIKRLLKQSLHYLHPNGVVAIEIDEDEVEILRLFLEANVFNDFVFKKDQFGRFRYLFIGDFKDEKSKNSNR